MTSAVTSQPIAILCPTGRDAELTHKVLREAAMAGTECPDMRSLCSIVDENIGAIVISDEALLPPGAFDLLSQALRSQPQWSDIPVMVLTGRGANSPVAIRALEQLGNVTLLERPLRISALVSSARAALRARQRQYQIRAHVVERELSEHTLREAGRRKDEFLATLAHELRNPLAPISNAAYLMRRLQKDDSLQSAREIIERQVWHLARLVEDLLDVSRISRGRVDLRIERVELADVVRNAIETSQPLIDARQHRLEVSLPADPTPIDVDGTRIAQVIANLLNNAAKYTPRGGVISLSVVRESAWVTIRVRDSGIGIAPQLLESIFDMFVQADNRLEREMGGLGIGLTLVRHFVEMHGGTVRARSNGSGNGSEFVVTLPVVAQYVDGRSSGPEPSASAQPPGGLRIMVVDDSRDSAESMSSLLRTFGNEVAVASSGAEALEQLTVNVPHVVLLDIGMPGMNGYEVARRIRADSRTSGVLLIAMTGWGQDSDRKLSREAGFDHHLVKPVDVDLLLSALQAVRGAT